jgi:signal transduction histidine kinase/ActR/RegA family two-component response regulator
MNAMPSENEKRILVLMPTAQDSMRTCEILHDAGLVGFICSDMNCVCKELGEGVGVVLLTDDAIHGEGAELLATALDAQPSWSDVPLVVLSREGTEAHNMTFRESANATLVERPVRMRTLLSVVRSALRARQRQYEVRDHLAERHKTDRRKDEFIAMLAHELRNPLAPIRNGLQVMRFGANDPNAIREASMMMERQLTHMVRLIDDLLDVSRISRNKMELRKTKVSLADVLSSAIETARPLIDAGGHALSVSIPAEPIIVDADLTRLAQVFGNLLCNSAKYTPPGGRIWLEAELQDMEAVVSVRDDGIGIPAESLDVVFDMFTQVDRSVERSTGGLGIGLALVKGLVEMHGGNVTAESPGENCGSTFVVRIPALKRVEECEKVNLLTTVPTGNGHKRRFLVVDDNKDSATTMAMMLKLFGNEVRSAYDGFEAVEASEKFRPQVILMDVGMPKLNGYKATQIIRERPWGKGIIIIALTGWGQESDRVQSKQAGCDGHLVKPVSLPDLEKMLADLTGKSEVSNISR